ncbi:MAG TPA: F0F1 ATP synthase subunit epsilon [Ktedonobacteraceae bacterium]|nr:F0F1 ATP synthase subunit epsilon [Ktedonobacteraceae bacterium]
MATMQVAVVTGEREIYRGEAEEVVAPGVAGEMGILPHHAALVTALKPGEMRIKLGGAEEDLFVSGGFLEVYNNVVTVLADAAEHAEDIDRARAEEARRRAQERLAEVQDERERALVTGALERAIVRLRIVETTRRRSARRIQAPSSSSE